MKNVLVTGAAGFLGSHLMLRHLALGDKVLGVDDYSSSALGTEHVKKICGFKNGVLRTCDITDYEGLREIVLAFKHNYIGLRDTIDLIYNFACPASPPRYQTIPIETMMTCTVGVNNVLRLAKNEGAVVVHASTSEIYGDPNVSPQEESYRGNVNSYGPRACYDEGKRAAEALCFDYQHKHDVDVRLVRIFNTYGPHMQPDDGRVVSNFICQALRGEALTIYGDGLQTRSFCYVDDLIDGVVKLGSLFAPVPEPINLGNPKDFTIIDLAMMVRDLIDLNVAVEFCPLPTDDPTQRKPDITRAKHFLDWEPKVLLRDGLRKTVEYFKCTLQSGH